MHNSGPAGSELVQHGFIGLELVQHGFIGLAKAACKSRPSYL